MIQPTETNQPPEKVLIPENARHHLPLIAAVALTVIAAAIFVYELTTVASQRTEPRLVASLDSGAAPVPLSSQPLSFLNQPAAVPDLKFIDGGGKPLSLANFKGYPVLLNIWATWCLPCRKEMPSLDRLQAKFDPAKFRVLTLSIDRAGIPAVKKFYADLGIKSLGVYVDQPNAALSQLGLVGIPGTLLINPEGQEVGRKLGPAEWDSPEVIALLREHFGVEPLNSAAGATP
jgi:thiol-disulfide isomerase/thioredoxin